MLRSLDSIVHSSVLERSLWLLYGQLMKGGGKGWRPDGSTGAALKQRTAEGHGSERFKTVLETSRMQHMEEEG